MKNEGWKTVAADGQKMGSNRTSNKNFYDVYTVTKNIWSSPIFRLVNSNNQVVSDEIQIAPSGRSNRGKRNTAQIGYAYYASIKHGWNQSNKVGSIKLQMKIY